MWIREFELALVLKDTDRLNSLMNSIPKFTDRKDINSVLCLLEEATSLVQLLKDDTEASMVQIQKNVHYLKSTQEKRSAAFDVTS